MTDLEYLKKYGNRATFLEDQEKLKQGVPVQYLVGHVSFYGYPIKVNPHVLIPRFETEELVEKVLHYVKEKTAPLRIADIGTGSGCIAIALAKKLRSEIVAVDISKEALAVARENATINQVSITFLEGNLLEPLEGSFDVIISNPPYIAKEEEIMEIVRKNEPALALYAEEDGTYCYRKMLESISPYLKKQSLVAFEIGADQGEKLLTYAQQLFPNQTAWIEQDLQGRDRFFFLSIDEVTRLL